MGPLPDFPRPRLGKTAGGGPTGVAGTGLEGSQADGIKGQQAGEKSTRHRVPQVGAGPSPTALNRGSRSPSQPSLYSAPASPELAAHWTRGFPGL